MEKIFHRPHAPRALCSLLILFALVPSLSSCSSSESAKGEIDEAQYNAERDVELAPEAKIFVDDAMLKRPHAILGGTVMNVGSEKLTDLRIELELRRREDGSVERREVPVNPTSLAPGEKGRYTLKILSDEWGSSKVASLRSSSRGGEIVFQALPGAQRPPERAQGSPNWSRQGRDSRPSSKPKGEEFINTPDNPVSVP